MENGFRAFHRAKMSSQETQVNTVACMFLPITKLKSEAPILAPNGTRMHTAVHVGTALIGSYVQALTKFSPKEYVVASSYLFPVLQSCEDLLIKHNIDLVSFEYQNSET